MDRRVRRNPEKMAAGKEYVLLRLETVGTRCNPKLSTDLGDEEVGYMECKAKVYEGETLVGEGAYDSVTSTHAEMNALAAAMAAQGSLSKVTRIEITAPPCKSCAFVLELLTVIDKVVTTKGIYKHATGSWSWPAALQDDDDFSILQWYQIREHFSGSGLSDGEVRDAMVKVVRTQSKL
jgi:deoxycytidylate deaminase